MKLKTVTPLKKLYFQISKKHTYKLNKNVFLYFQEKIIPINKKAVIWLTISYKLNDDL